MDANTFSLQQSRVASFLAHQLSALAHFVSIVDDEPSKRSSSKFEPRLKWDQFVTRYKDKPLFRRHLRMLYESFCLLVEKIQEHLDPVHSDIKEIMGGLRGGLIIPELHLYATIQYLARASYTDICIFCGVSLTKFYDMVWRTIHAINRAIEIGFPRSRREECQANAKAFENISYGEVIQNCVGVVDGFLLSIQTPTKLQAKNVPSYFSGHYQRDGVNVQACCDVYCHFIFLGIGGPGVTKDRVGVKESGLFDLIESIPEGFVTIGDCAYQPTERMVPIFGGDLALKKDNDNFNFYASQLQIRIEMAFGLMARKWGILQRPLMNHLGSIKHIICAIARLHNFCIDEQLKKDPTHKPSSSNSYNSLPQEELAYMHSASEVENHEILSDEYPQWSLLREALVALVERAKQKGLVRPDKNQIKKIKT